AAISSLDSTVQKWRLRCQVMMNLCMSGKLSCSAAETSGTCAEQLGVLESRQSLRRRGGEDKLRMR
ncbi:hypothetical protein ACLKA7_017711, partial [Drosophila subpalustris]